MGHAALGGNAGGVRGTGAGLPVVGSVMSVLGDFCVEEGYLANTTAMNGKNLFTVSRRGLSMNPRRNLVKKLSLAPESAANSLICAVLSGSKQARTVSAEDIGTMPHLHLTEGASQYPMRVKPRVDLHLTEAEARYRAKVPKSLKSVLWENLSVLMEERKTNMWRLSIDAKVSPATVHKLREKQTAPRLDVLEAIASALDVEVWQLLKPPSEQAYTEEALELAALFDALPNQFERAKANALARLVLAGQLPPLPVQSEPEPAPAPIGRRPVAHAGAPSSKPRRTR